MQNESLREQARSLLSQNLLPGKDQDRIRESLSSLEHIITELRHSDPSSAQSIINKSQDLYYQAECHRLSPRTSAWVRAGLNDLTYRLSDMLRRVQSTPQAPSGFLVSTQTLKEQKGLSSLGISGKEYKHIPYVLFDSDPEVLTAATKIGLRPQIEKIYYAAPIHSVRQSQWNLKMIGAPQAWRKAAGDGVKVGVIDSGIHADHAEIHHCFGDEKGYNFVDHNNDISDKNGHGTHVSGTIAGMDVGVAPNVSLYALKTFDASGYSVESRFLESCEWAIDHGLDLLNASFGSTKSSRAEQEMIKALSEHSITLVAAAGNNSSNEYSYPASYDKVISVAAVDQDKKHAPFSQRNDRLNVSAPGVGVYSCVPRGYESFSGTSMAAPHVTGAMALLHAYDCNQDKESTLSKTAEFLGDETTYGAGLLRVDRILR